MALDLMRPVAEHAVQCRTVIGWQRVPATGLPPHPQQPPPARSGTGPLAPMRPKRLHLGHRSAMAVQPAPPTCPGVPVRWSRGCGTTTNQKGRFLSELAVDMPQTRVPPPPKGVRRVQPPPPPQKCTHKRFAWEQGGSLTLATLAHVWRFAYVIPTPLLLCGRGHWGHRQIVMCPATGWTSWAGTGRAIVICTRMWTCQLLSPVPTNHAVLPAGGTTPCTSPIGGNNWGRWRRK